MKKDITSEEQLKKIIKEVGNLVVDDIGAFSRLGGAVIVQRLPKTRSGKVLRRILRKILNKEEFKIPPTIEDEAVLGEIKEALVKGMII